MNGLQSVMNQLIREYRGSDSGVRRNHLSKNVALSDRCGGKNGLSTGNQGHHENYEVVRVDRRHDHVARPEALYWMDESFGEEGS